MIKKILSLFKRKKLNVNIGKCGIIEPTSVALDSGIDNKYNRKIVIYKNIKVRDNQINYGKIIEEIPYTEEEAINLMKIKRIPIVLRKVTTKVESEQGLPFGEIIN